MKRDSSLMGTQLSRRVRLHQTCQYSSRFHQRTCLLWWREKEAFVFDRQMLQLTEKPQTTNKIHRAGVCSLQQTRQRHCNNT